MQARSAAQQPGKLPVGVDRQGLGVALYAFFNADRYGKVEHISTSEHAWR